MQYALVGGECLLKPVPRDGAFDFAAIRRDCYVPLSRDAHGSLLAVGTMEHYYIWPAEGYEPGHGQPSFDKQFARDWLKANPDNDWTLPEDIVEKTISKYLQAYELLTGEKL